MFGNITRGGQTLLHRMRMFRQVAKTSFVVSFFVGTAIFTLILWHKISSEEWKYAAAYCEAQLLLNMPLMDDPTSITQNYTLPNGNNLTLKSINVIHNKAVLEGVNHIFLVVEKAFWFSLFSIMIVAGFFFFGWSWRGREQNKTSHLRGASLIEAKKIKKLLRKKKQASDLSFAGVPIVKNTETMHILLAGTTGAGKTNAINQLIQQIRMRGDKAIIVDVVGNYVQKFHRKDQDIILNPFDIRCVPWHFWADLKQEPHYNEAAASIIQGSSHYSSDKFWIESAQVIFSELLKKLHEENNTSNQELAKHIFKNKLYELEDFMRDTCASRLITEDADKMAYGILAQLAPPLQAIKYMPDSKISFSIRDWIAKEEDSCLFLSSHPSHRDLSTSFLSYWLDTAVSGLMSLPEENNRRIWFIIDELPALQKLKCLPVLLKEGRKFGGCVLAGFQSISDISNKYGYDESKVILDCFNTKVFFRSKDPQTTQYISKILGDEEIQEARESFSYGAHEMRDGTSLNKAKITKPLVMSSEITILNNLQAYLKLPGDFPITKLKFKYVDLPKISNSFLLKDNINIKELQSSSDKQKLLSVSENVDKKPKPLDLAISELKITGCHIGDRLLTIDLNSKKLINIPIEKISILYDASSEEKNDFNITKTRDSIKWPKIGFLMHIDRFLELCEEQIFP